MLEAHYYQDALSGIEFQQKSTCVPFLRFFLCVSVFNDIRVKGHVFWKHEY